MNLENSRQDIAQVDGPPPPEAPRPVLLTGEAPPGLWDRLSDLIEERGFGVERGDCHGANGLTNFADSVVRVRADVDDAQSVKSLAHEAGHVLLSDPAGLSGLDDGQYTFNYVIGWASQARGELTPGSGRPDHRPTGHRRRAAHPHPHPAGYAAVAGRRRTRCDGGRD